jgi:hypothetical protein
MKRSFRPRTTAELSKSLNHQLNMYALAAGAAGVGLLGLAPPAEGKIIYTPAHINVGQLVPVDLNHDGVVDFYLLHDGGHGGEKLSACQYWQSLFSSIACSSSSRGTNVIRTIDSKGRKYAAALPYGARIQGGEQFAKRQVLLGGVWYGTNWYGPWMNGGKGVKNRYLGLKFKIKGRFHFGWARITVTPANYIAATLTGYAYETIPGKGIVAGKTNGPDLTTVSPASLGHLAAGSSANPAWRSGR